MQVYWASVFILPDAIIKDIEKILRGFLWCQGEMKRGKTKVKWDDLCKPKDEGGLGLKRLKHWNVALMSTHIWSIITRKESLWVRWIHMYKLEGTNFWNAPIKADASWSWRKILCMRTTIRGYITHVIGNGRMTNAWYDNWCSISPLSEIVSSRDIYAIQNIATPVLVADNDTIKWKGIDDNLHGFFVGIVWNSIRPRAPQVCQVLNEPIKGTNWSYISSVLAPIAGRNRANVVVTKLCFAASIYYVWQERNNRLFAKESRSTDKLFEIIFSTVRMKMLTIKFKDSRDVAKMKVAWHLS
ncbi:uncharacterized protein [Rutidosis leptorrhynchoides]|uniref:uncharacterized protein n=1 Tax=Rutidosis leptorrhynchoides TaxID=125765 RepID=UPI003A99F651